MHLQFVQTKLPLGKKLNIILLIRYGRIRN